LLSFCAFLCFSIDLGRAILAGDQLEHATESAAIYVYSRACNADGSFSLSDASKNMLQALKRVSEPVAWNFAPAGSSLKSPVTFTPEDLQVEPNPADDGDFTVKLTARRAGAQSIIQVLLPFIETKIGTGSTRNSGKLSLSRTCEVIGQPATRIGPGKLDSSDQWSSPFAVLPLAISLEQFKDLANPDETQRLYYVDTFSTAAPGQKPPAGHIRGCFVNVCRSKQPGSFYGGNDDENAAEELIGSWRYFCKNKDQARLPACVERGSKLSCFDETAAPFVNAKAQLLACLKGLPANSYCVIPVTTSDPVPGQTVEIAGFARLKLISALNTTGTQFNFCFEVADSVPVRNAVATSGVSCTIPGTLVPPLPSSGPFSFRSRSDDIPNGFTKRPRAVVLAPALCPPNL
jgi:Flp pilus assembly protein TadG